MVVEDVGLDDANWTEFVWEAEVAKIPDVAPDYCTKIDVADG